jgi:predicted Zn-dependent protease with MMP-like domain
MRQTFSPDAAAIERLADAALARLPETFRAMLEGVVLRIVEMPDEEMLDDLGIDCPYDLTGLYSGRSLAEAAAFASGELPPMIHLFRVPLLLEWVETGVALEDLITHVIVHEVGHHFGLSDEAMHAIEDAAG